MEYILCCVRRQELQPAGRLYVYLYASILTALQAQGSGPPTQAVLPEMCTASTLTGYGTPCAYIDLQSSMRHALAVLLCALICAPGPGRLLTGADLADIACCSIGIAYSGMYDDMKTEAKQTQLHFFPRPMNNRRARITHRHAHHSGTHPSRPRYTHPEACHVGHL